MRNFYILTAFCVLIFVFILPAKPIHINYSAYLAETSGQARSDVVDKAIQFRLFAAKTGGAALWSETIVASAPGGVLNVKLGLTNPISPVIISNASELWLEMQVGSEEAFSRQEIATTFYAVSANMADTSTYAITAGNALNLGGKQAANYALKTEVPSIKIDSAKWSDTAKYAGNYTRDTKIDSSKFSDTANYAKNISIENGSVGTEQLANNSVTGIKIADSVITSAKLAAGAITSTNLPSSKTGNFDITGALSAGTVSTTYFNFKTPITITIALDAGRALPWAQKIDLNNWRGLKQEYASTITIPGDCQHTGAVTDTFAVFLPFTPPYSSTIKRITARVADGMPGSPYIAVSLLVQYYNQSVINYGAS